MMKRYLQCPGMCRVEVLKKFVRNKYNVDTSLFHIDVLYKRVPLPDHYTLIDIAYIYSWKRNEPMKFFFRITDINKVSERFDYFDSQNPMDFVVKTPARTSRNNGDRIGSSRKRENHQKKNSKTNKQASPKKDVCDENKSEHSGGDSNNAIETDRVTVDESKCDNISETDMKRSERNVSENDVSVDKVTINVNTTVCSSSGDEKKTVTDCTDKVFIKTEKDSPKIESNYCDQSFANELVKVKSEVPPPVENSGHFKSEIRNDKEEIKKAVYTNITLNRTNNVEIITKIQKVSNKAGQPIGLNIIKQTVKNNTATKKVPSCKKSPQTKSNSNKSVGKTITPKKIEFPKNDPSTTTNKNVDIVTKKDDSSESRAKQNSDQGSAKSDEEEKRKFLESIELTAKNIPCANEKKPDAQVTNSQKRKSSPSKNETNLKKAKIEKKPTTRIILSKPKQNQTPKTSLQNKGLKSLIENCKIPSSLSITIKDGTEDRLPSLIPPVKNFIEILKLPDETGQSDRTGKEGSATKLDFSLKMNDNDSEQKVDEDLAQIAKSLTERIPMSTTISEIVGPKPQFPIPMKTNVPLKFIQPSPVPELCNRVLNVPKENNKLNPRSPQTFQKIFEESIKKPEDEGEAPDKIGQKSALDLSNDNTGASATIKRNLAEIATQLFKKTKLEQENSCSDDSKVDETVTPKPNPKVPIPRLPNQRNLKPPQKNLKFEVADPMKFQQTLANLHSNALGMNYTISVGHNGPVKVNGVVPLAKQELDTKTASIPASSTEMKVNAFAAPKDIAASSPRPSPIPRNLSPAVGYNSPRNSPKHSPKSSPMIKHMYAPVPNLMMDQLRVNTFTQRAPSPKVSNFNKSPKSSPQLPSSSANLPSPSKHPIASPVSSPKPVVSSPKPSASSPKLQTSSSKPQVSSPKLPAMSPNGQASTSGQSVPSKASPKANTSGDQNPALSPNQILEKYNIQNLAQMSASLNFNANFGLNPNNQLAAIQHAMLLKHFEMQNRQNWMNMNQGPLVQYERYLQSLKNNHLLSNIKEN
nr:polycomb group protein Psc-like [Leptinotarsa decemlineata]